MKNRKLLALGLTACMAVSILSACGKDEPVAESKSEESKEVVQESKVEESEVEEEAGITFPLDETVKFTGFTDHQNNMLLSKSVAWNWLADEYANIEVEWNEVVRSECTEKSQLILAGGDYPDFFFRHVPSTETYGVEEGIYIPLEDMIREYMPNLTAILDEENGWDTLKSSDGHIYSIGIIRRLDGINWIAWFNQRWLDNVGMDMPTNMEEIYEVSKAFKEQDANGNGDPNDEIPTTFSTADYTIWATTSLIDDGMISGFDCIKDEEYVFYPFTEGYKEKFLRYWKRMWDEELVDHNAFTQTTDQMRAVSRAGDVLGWHMAHNPAGVVGNTEKVECYAWDPAGEANSWGYTRIGSNGLAITDKCENPEILLAMFDYLYTDEGGYLAEYGIEGVTYDLSEAGAVVLREEYVKTTEVAPSMQSGSNLVMLESPNVFVYDYDADYYSAHMNSERNKFAEKHAVVVPNIVYTEEEQEVRATYESDITAYVKTYSAEVITGIKDLDATWDEFQATLKAMGAEEVEAVKKAAVARAYGK